MLNNIFKFSEIDIKPHPRDDTDICNELSKNLKQLNLKVNILEKKIHLKLIIVNIHVLWASHLRF